MRVLPVFLTGGLAVQIRTELGFGAAALGIAVSLFFTTQALSSAPFGRIVERIGFLDAGMQAASLERPAASTICIALFAGSRNSLFGFLVLGGLANAVAQAARRTRSCRGLGPSARGWPLA